MNVLEQIEKKKSENLIFMAYCYKFEKQMKDERILKKTNEELLKLINKHIPELNNIELDILTLKLIVLIKFLIFKIHSKEL
ncbi:MAG: hypothetical protein ABIL49_02575 [candidate division WOR-3 bacterium]